MTLNKLIEELKENNQDFEFYPTSKEMIKTIYDHADSGDWLDIGAGTCNFKKYFEEFAKIDTEIYNENRAKHIHNYYVIEKSEILLQQMDKDVICLGTDFNQIMLLDKPVKNIFCNPPYSEFEEWTKRLIYEANANRIYLVIPQRWNENEEIKTALKKTNSTARVLGSFDFLNAERQARAKVDIVKISRSFNRYDNLKDYNEKAFDQWFDDTFKMRDKKDIGEWEQEDIKKRIVKNKLVNAEQSKGKILVDLYNEEIETLYSHFKAIAGLDVDILDTIGVSKKAVKEALKLKASGAKTRYWKLALDELDEITDRLTSQTRKEMFEKFALMHTVDFTIENLYPFLLWVLKNANQYYNDQLITFFKELTSPENVKPYKSNQKAFTEEYWGGRRMKDNASHYILDYRIIMSSPFRQHWYSGQLDNYQEGARQTLQDILTIANNLGFKVGELKLCECFGEKVKIYYKNSDKVFMEYRAYKNGNMHTKFDIEFTKALNVEVSRLFGWIKSADDIKNEFPAELAQGAEKYFKQNYTCLNTNSMTLLTTKKPKIDFTTNEEQSQITINQNYTDCLNIILNQIDNFNAIIEDNSELVRKCLKILETEKGFIYRNCLISKGENETIVQFREINDFNQFIKAVA